jgi:SAM-dependent methyltransferase
MPRAASPAKTEPATKRVCLPASGDDSAPATKSSVHALLADKNGSEWYARYKKIQTLLTPDVLSKTLTTKVEDITGFDAYAKPSEGDTETRYDVVLNWQENYWHIPCDAEGVARDVDAIMITDDGMMKAFYTGRAGKSLDAGCNTGKNMLRAIDHSNGKIDTYGIEYSQDSVDLAVKALGSDHVFQGDATKDFVTQRGWEGKFAFAHCNFVLQHMDPEGVDAALGNIAKSLAVGGEFLTTFKDAPTKGQMEQRGMGHWSQEVFSATMHDEEAYVKDGYLHTVIWDDDYYPGVTSKTPPCERDLQMAGPHRRELYFYSLPWIVKTAKKYSMVPKEVAVVCDAKMPFSVFSWKVTFAKE